MNKTNLKKYITKILLEKVDTSPSVVGKLVKKKIGFTGIQRECVCEGTIADVNTYATNNKLQFTRQDNTHFGGHYNSEMTSYEFHPNPEFYGKIMEFNMSAKEQLSRISGATQKVLTESSVKTVDVLVNFIYTNDSFRENRANMVFEKINRDITNKLYDKTQFTKLFEYLAKQASTHMKKRLSESQLEYATKLISQKFFEGLPQGEETISEKETQCGKKSFKTGSAFENMQRIASGHQMFL